jgi:hypothetical protein
VIAAPNTIVLKSQFFDRRMVTSSAEANAVTVNELRHKK